MKNLPVKNFKKKTNTLYRYNHLSGVNQLETTVGETDPTNTTITILTTASGQPHFSQRQSPLKLLI
jgi:hypothetical protein